jgi:S-DNA-T family DNA segregation ATPase FtsK/SpoIIIE
MTKSDQDPALAERLSAEPPRRAVRPNPTRPRPPGGSSDDGLTQKIGRMLVRWMSPIAAESRHDPQPPRNDPESPPRPRPARPAAELRPGPRIPDGGRPPTKISPPGKAVLKPRPSRATPSDTAPSVVPPEARRANPIEPGPLARSAARPAAAPERLVRPVAVAPGTAVKSIEPISVEGSEDEEADVEPVESDIEGAEPSEVVEEKPQRARWSPTVRRYAAIIEQTLIEFGAPCQVVHAETGPMILRFGVAPGYLQKPARGDQPPRRERVRAAKIVSRASDLTLALGVTSLRIEAPVPGKTYIGIEVPNPNPKTVPLSILLDAPEFAAHAERSVLPVALGRDVSGQPIFADLARLPHLLIAGATGSGKSVAVNSIIGALLRTRTPEDVRIIVVDPKRVEFTWLAGVPHLIAPVVTDIEKAVDILGKAETEMARRYDLLAGAGCRNRLAYNQKHLPTLPALVVVVDELADLMMLASNDVERSICRLAQLGRAAGIHLVVATQRPSVDVVTGLIKANLPARQAFAVSSMVDSRTILDTPGAERLLGRGDFLYLPPDAMKPVRGQGAFARDSWLNGVVRTARAARPAGTADPEGERFSKLLSATQIAEDKLYVSARSLAEEHPKVSASYLQRKLRIGYPKAMALIERLRADGILEDPDLDDDGE